RCKASWKRSDSRCPSPKRKRGIPTRSLAYASGSDTHVRRPIRLSLTPKSKKCYKNYTSGSAPFPCLQGSHHALPPFVDARLGFALCVVGLRGYAAGVRRGETRSRQASGPRQTPGGVPRQGRGARRLGRILTAVQKGIPASGRDAREVR